MSRSNWTTKSIADFLRFSQKHKRTFLKLIVHFCRRSKKVRDAELRRTLQASVSTCEQYILILFVYLGFGDHMTNLMLIWIIGLHSELDSGSKAVLCHCIVFFLFFVVFSLLFRCFFVAFFFVFFLLFCRSKRNEIQCFVIKIRLNTMKSLLP